ncbi:MAG: pyrimidine/purine nucleoside phosphorylase [Proteobacteria bacterium]|nr:pyrimidine/purine nucleoside phosphorylase [Pseudomonadota bacterium]MBU1453633.1 pyrimidine/purine nucleoside phosphorylase [Pseudomonadota bacterium]
MFKTNEYFDGNVKSISFTCAEGPATVGVMAVGEYTFGTDSIEVMTVVSGAMDIKLPDSDEWQTFQAGESFEVEKGVKFGVRVTTETSYLCLYK